MRNLTEIEKLIFAASWALAMKTNPDDCDEAICFAQQSVRNFRHIQEYHSWKLDNI